MEYWMDGWWEKRWGKTKHNPKKGKVAKMDCETWKKYVPF